MTSGEYPDRLILVPIEKDTKGNISIRCQRCESKITKSSGYVVIDVREPSTNSIRLSFPLCAKCTIAFGEWVEECPPLSNR